MERTETLTKNQKNRLRKAKRRSQTPKLPDLPPFRLNTVVAGGSRYSSVIHYSFMLTNRSYLLFTNSLIMATQVLGAISTLDRLHPKSWLRNPTLTEDSRFEALLSKVEGIDIGSGFREALPALRSSEAFRARSLRLLGKF